MATENLSSRSASKPQPEGVTFRIKASCGCSFESEWSLSADQRTADQRHVHTSSIPELLCAVHREASTTGRLLDTDYRQMLSDCQNMGKRMFRDFFATQHPSAAAA